MAKVTMKTNNANSLGRVGENDYTVAIFPDSQSILNDIPGAIVTILNQRPGDRSAYPVDPGFISIENGVVNWKIQSGDLTKTGAGRCELIFKSGDIIAKSIIYDTYIANALEGNAKAPAPWISWVDKVIDAGHHMPVIQDDTWWVWDPVTNGYVNTGVAATGPQGIQGIQGIQGVQGEVGPRGLKGDKGDKGDKGEQGTPGKDYYIQPEDINKIGTSVAQSKPVQDSIALTIRYAQEAEYAKSTIQNMTARAYTLNAWNNAQASYDKGVMTFGIPRGTTFTPAVSSNGVLSWSNDGGRVNPAPVNIMGHDYVITPENIHDIGTQVMNSTPVSDIIDDASAWATGTKHNGTPVDSSKPQYENNARHYAELTARYAARAQTLVDGAVQTIDDAGAEQVQAVEDKGTEVLDSLPADYSALTREVAEAAQDETGQEMLSALLSDTMLIEAVLLSIGSTFDKLPQDEEAMDIMYSIKLEADRLEAIYENWLAEKEGA